MSNSISEELVPDLMTVHLLFECNLENMCMLIIFVILNCDRTTTYEYYSIAKEEICYTMLDVVMMSHI